MSNVSASRYEMCARFRTPEPNSKYLEENCVSTRMYRSFINKYMYTRCKQRQDVYERNTPVFLVFRYTLFYSNAYKNIVIYYSFKI
jgi:hypothetical protein